ncbi:hypothetical protein AVEN_266013-1 [Araneus ventricosus]|uniref:DNA helicase Pif1-like 2B domain-containing protein n=1 Tax=Araneus ventricosus TaxID=182803 RepID=A0A4Y2TT62_ARAVE|nr:hypothetical protein AVEN_266013-1 [Araneus ventricosus]
MAVTKSNSWPKKRRRQRHEKATFTRIAGSVQIYKSIDTTCGMNETVNYPSELFNILEPFGLPSHTLDLKEPFGLPSHTLDLKIEAPIMLLMNLHPPSLCKGTILCIMKLMPNIIEATIITGHTAGEDVFFLKIPIIPSNFPF